MHTIKGHRFAFGDEVALLYDVKKVAIKNKEPRSNKDVGRFLSFILTDTGSNIEKHFSHFYTHSAC